MDDSPTSDPQTRSLALPLILKAVRRRRGLRAAEVARAMDLPLRTYQRFESGVGGLDIQRIHHFAEVVDADGWAIVFALDMDAPAFALHCLDNKAASVLMLALQRFNAKAGGHIARLDPRSLILAFTRTFDELEAKARDDAAYLEQWMFDEALTGDPPDQA